MMPFAEKLSFLMHITSTSNKELAAELSVDPSLVSLMRTGKRKLSKNPAQAKKMALFFAKRCSAAFQRQALSEMLGQVSISSSMPVEALATCLEHWLQGERDIASEILTGIRELPSLTANDPQPFPLPAPLSFSAGQTQFLYGEEGRREAMRRVVQECRSMEKPGTVLTVVDDNLEWLLSDYALTKQIQAWMMEEAEQGFTFYQIVPPMNYVNRYAESLRFWLPVYATGKTKVYYYPRLRGNLYRHSMIVVPGRCVQFAVALGPGKSSDITVFSTDLQLVGAFEKQFQEYLSLCRPALNVHRDTREAIPCFLDFFSCHGNSVELINSLSITSAPRELLERWTQESKDAVWATTFQIYLDNLSHFEEQLSQDRFIDMCYLASAKEIRSGTVPVASSSRNYCGQPYYTPETYCLHLKNILRLMEQYENYIFLPLAKKEYTDYDLFVSEDNMALIVRTAEPLMTLEIRRQPMVTAFQEHLLRRAEAAAPNGFSRESIRLELRSLIQELGG